MASDPGQSGLLIDLYQLTMIEGYLKNGLTETAVFEFFVRALPAHRGFLVAAGLETFLEFVETLHFESDDLEWLAGRGTSDRLVEYLRDFRFTGEIHALPEGTIFFPQEPILRVTAPLPAAQLLETRAINVLHFQSLIASKAVRMILAAPGKRLVDFGLRRAHGAEAGLLAARAAYLAGLDATSNVLAGRMWGIPLSGTMAHSFVQAHDDEETAFLQFARANPGDVTLILDTYDVNAAAHKVVSVQRTLNDEGIHVHAVRLDSGDLVAQSRLVRSILDAAGLRDVRIFASGGLDEWKLAQLVNSGAPIDGFGVGASVDVSSDAPSLDCAYKLQEYAGKPRRKRSEGKATWPGRKQIHRFSSPNGQFSHDEVSLDDGSASAGEPLVVPVMRDGKRLNPTSTLADARHRLVDQLARLPERWQSLGSTAPFPVTIMPPVLELAERLDHERC